MSARFIDHNNHPLDLAPPSPPHPPHNTTATSPTHSPYTPLTMPTDLTVADYQTILAFTTNLARRAGEVILAGSQAIRNAPASEINEKKNSVDLVTEYDVKVEELVKKEIAGKYPDFEL